MKEERRIIEVGVADSAKLWWLVLLASSWQTTSLLSLLHFLTFTLLVTLSVTLNLILTFGQRQTLLFACRLASETRQAQAPETHHVLSTEVGRPNIQDPNSKLI